jgi:hypothetical protein
MRSIGARNRNMVKRLVRTAIDKRRLPWGGYSTTYLNMEVESEVRGLLPVSLWDTWEAADQEIDRIISDTIAEAI